MTMAAESGEAGGGGRHPAARLRLRLPSALPHLQGRRGGAVRAVYIALALAVAAVIAGSFWFNGRDYFGNMPAAASYGFRTQTGSGTPSIAGSFGQARASGLARGDRIVSIDGEALPPDATEFTIGERLSSDADGQVAIVARSQSGEVKTHRLVRSPVGAATPEPVTGMRLWLFIAIGITATQLPLVVWLAASVLLAVRRPRDPEAMLFAFAALLISVPAGGFWLTALLGVPRLAQETVGNIGACMLLIAIAGFPDGRFPNLLARVTAVLLCLLAGALMLNSAGLAMPLGPAFLVCNLLLLACVWLRFRRGGADTERQQMKWALFGFAAALALLVPVQVADVLGLIQSDGLASFLAEYVMVNLGLLMIPVGLLVSLLRYRLYDAEAAISLSAGYAVLTLMLGSTFAASAEVLEWLFEKNVGGDAGALPGALAAALAVVLVTPLHNRVHRWAEGRFQKPLLRLRRDLPDCVGDLRETGGLDALLGETLERLSSSVRSVRSAVLIGEEIAAVRDVERAEVEAWRGAAVLGAGDGGLDCRRDDPLFPLRLPLRVRHGGGGEIGWILLGPRPDGSFYGADEREALAEVADPVARAVQVVRSREEREARLKAIEERLAGLAKRSPRRAAAAE